MNVRTTLTCFVFSFVAALVASACEGAGGSGGADCPAQCQTIVALCADDPLQVSQPTCEQTCTTDTAGKTAASVAAAGDCIAAATACQGAIACEDLLVASPEVSGSAAERAEASAQGLCEKFGSCGMPAGSMAECVQAGETALGYVVDVPAFISCVHAESCTDLQTDQSVATDCLDLDWASFRCEGDTTLHYCNNAGLCAGADCAAACLELENISRSGCGGSGTTESEHPKCLCYR